MKIHDRPDLRNRRKELRKRLTPAEAFLWRHLNRRQLHGRKFRRQHSIGPFIVDFYCGKEKLIVELDGEVHNNPVADSYDKKREKYLQRLGFSVIRFENKYVFGFLTQVLQEIRDNFKA